MAGLGRSAGTPRGPARGAGLSLAGLSDGCPGQSASRSPPPLPRLPGGRGGAAPAPHGGGRGRSGGAGGCPRAAVPPRAEQPGPARRARAAAGRGAERSKRRYRCASRLPCPRRVTGRGGGWRARSSRACCPVHGCPAPVSGPLVPTPKNLPNSGASARPLRPPVNPVKGRLGLLVLCQVCFAAQCWAFLCLF